MTLFETLNDAIRLGYKVSFSSFALQFEISSEVETGQCLWCSSLINHRNKYCDKRCEGLFLRNKEI